MNRLQKIAWYNLIMTVVSLSFSAGAVAVLALIVGMPRALGGLGFLGLGGLMGLAPVIFRKEKGQVSFDERDALIELKAARAGFGASYVFFVAVCMITWFAVGIKGLVSVNMLPMMVCGGLLVLVLVQSIVVLHEYGWGGKDGGE